MKNITFFILFVFALSLSGQNSNQQLPKSWTISSLEAVAPITLEKPNLSRLIAEDLINDKDKSIPWRFGYDHHVNFGFSNSGTWTTLANGDRIWRVNFISPEALSMNLIFDQFEIPIGAKVYISNDDRSERLNPITLEQYPSLQSFDFDAAISVLNVPTILCDESIFPVLRLTNVGNTTLTSATVTYQLDSGAQSTINWTGSLVTGATEDLPLSAIPVSGVGPHSFTASVSNPNGTTDQDLSNNLNGTNFEIPETYVTTTIRVIITPDRYGAETTWTLTDSNNNVVGSGGPYTTVGTNGTQPDEIQDVPISALNGCYTFTINDSYGDGICCLYGAGTFRLEDGNSNILYNGNGAFGGTTSHLFKVNEALSVSESNLDEHIKIYPNPFSTDFNLSITGSDVSYELINIVGQKIGGGVLQNGVNTISMVNRANGLYFIKINTSETNESITKKIVKH